MSKKILLSTVIFLAMLIIVCFVLLFVGLYLKFSGNQNISEIEAYSNSLNLADNEKIIDIEVMNQKQLLIVISNSIDTYGAIYDIDKKTIISEIKK
tara:strand:- start:9199 stop:9486 length:288 start_codon:yes stop_codon:yes gene_type:complete